MEFAVKRLLINSSYMYFVYILYFININTLSYILKRETTCFPGQNYCLIRIAVLFQKGADTYHPLTYLQCLSFATISVLVLFNFIIRVHGCHRCEHFTFKVAFRLSEGNQENSIEFQKCIMQGVFD